MSGLQNNGVPAVGPLYGSETANLDTGRTGGTLPISGAASLVHLAAVMNMLANNTSATPVAGTRYYVSTSIGFDQQITGVQFLIGATGGTDNAIVELHDSTGALVATSLLAGTLVGAAGTYQRIAFTAPYNAKAGQYFIVLQLSGTTARFAQYNAPSTPLLTGSATGTFGTGAAITPPTTYTAARGPVALLY
jgi:hypothetical protein